MQILKRNCDQLWDIALIKKFFWLSFNDKEYVFAMVQIYPKAPPFVDDNTGFKIVQQDAIGETFVIPAQSIEHKVVVLSFSDFTQYPGYQHRKISFILSEYI